MSQCGTTVSGRFWSQIWAGISAPSSQLHGSRQATQHLRLLSWKTEMLTATAQRIAGVLEALSTCFVPIALTRQFSNCKSPAANVPDREHVEGINWHAVCITWGGQVHQGPNCILAS